MLYEFVKRSPLSSILMSCPEDWLNSHRLNITYDRKPRGCAGMFTRPLLCFVEMFTQDDDEGDKTAKHTPN